MVDLNSPVRVLSSDGRGSRLTLDADQATITIGGLGRSGEVIIVDGDGGRVVEIEEIVGGARLRMRGSGQIVAEIASSLGASVLALGGGGTDGSVSIKNAAGDRVIFLNGRDADLVIRGADTAEMFRLSDVELRAPEPGTVMVLTVEESVRVSDHECDTTVVGIVSGAGDLHPGLVLAGDHQDGIFVPIALAGTVYCLADAAEEPIECGDLLTTASRRGHAMSCRNASGFQGAVVGKALRGLATGQSPIPILVMHA